MTVTEYINDDILLFTTLLFAVFASLEIFDLLAFKISGGSKSTNFFFREEFENSFFLANFQDSSAIWWRLIEVSRVFSRRTDHLSKSASCLRNVRSKIALKIITDSEWNTESTRRGAIYPQWRSGTFRVGSRSTCGLVGSNWRFVECCWRHRWRSITIQFRHSVNNNKVAKTNQ